MTMINRPSDFTRGRAVQYLLDRGYPAYDIAEDGISADGYEIFVRDDAGDRITDREAGCAKTEVRRWAEPRDWIGLREILYGA